MGSRASTIYGGRSGIHFTDPAEFYPFAAPVANIGAHDSANTRQNSSTTAFFTEMARRGIQEQTNWTADTYKTLLNLTSPKKGFVAAVVGPTAGASETTTFEFTVDGAAAQEIAIPVASGERAILVSVGHLDTFFATGGYWLNSYNQVLDSNKQYFTNSLGGGFTIPGWATTSMINPPQLKFSDSLLIRAKHSANITNSTATAYSAVMYRRLL